MYIQTLGPSSLCYAVFLILRRRVIFPDESCSDEQNIRRTELDAFFLRNSFEIRNGESMTRPRIVRKLFSAFFVVFYEIEEDRTAAYTMLCPVYSLIVSEVLE